MESKKRLALTIVILFWFLWIFSEVLFYGLHSKENSEGEEYSGFTPDSYRYYEMTKYFSGEESNKDIIVERRPVYPLFSALFYIMYPNTIVMLFIPLITSLLSVIYFYKLLELLSFSEIESTIGTIFFTTYWLFTDLSLLALTDVPAFFFELCLIYYFLEYRIKNQNNNIKITLFSLLAFLTRPTVLTAIASIFFLEFLKNRSKIDIKKTILIFVSGVLIFLFRFTNILEIIFTSENLENLSFFNFKIEGSIDYIIFNYYHLLFTEDYFGSFLCSCVILFVYFNRNRIETQLFFLIFVFNFLIIVKSNIYVTRYCFELVIPVIISGLWLTKKIYLLLNKNSNKYLNFLFSYSFLFLNSWLYPESIEFVESFISYFNIY